MNYMRDHPALQESNVLAPQRGEWQPDGQVWDQNGNRVPTYMRTRWENKSYWNGNGGPTVRSEGYLDESAHAPRGNEGVFEQWSRPNANMRRDGSEQGRMLALKPNSGIFTDLKRVNNIGIDEDPRVMARTLRINPRLEAPEDRLFRHHMGIEDKLLPRSGFEPITQGRNDDARLSAITNNPMYVPNHLEMATMVGNAPTASDAARHRLDHLARTLYR